MTAESAKAALRKRQGSGARYDAPEAPHEDLLQARRATALFARCLNSLTDADMDTPVKQDGWTRRHVIAHVGYQARSMAQLFRDVSKGDPAIAQPLPEIAKAATLPARALRHLFEHSAIHLDVEWRDLPGTNWSTTFMLEDGTATPLSQCPNLRAQALHASARLISTI